MSILPGLVLLLIGLCVYVFSLKGYLRASHNRPWHVSAEERSSAEKRTRVYKFLAKWLSPAIMLLGAILMLHRTGWL